MHNYNICFPVVLGGDLVKSTEHLGISYLAAVLRKAGYSVWIIEINDRDDINDFIEKLEERNIKFVGFSTTIINIDRVEKITTLIKKRFGLSITIAYGGHMATFAGKELITKIKDVDYIIRGEGEETILDLINSIQNNSSKSNVIGVTFRDANGDIISNEDRPLIENLDSLPFPCRDQFEQHNQRLQYLRICSSRGCYGNCSYCSSYVGRNYKQRWRGRSPKNIVDEIESLVNKYDFHTFDFIDSTFEDPPNNIGKNRIRDIAQEIVNRGLKIYYNSCFRAENWHHSDHDLLDLLVKSGLEKINVGFEAGNDKTLLLFNKIAKTKDNLMALEVIKKHPEIYITFGFIFYHPYSTFSDFNDNAKFLHETGFGQITRHYFWPLEVYPFTKIKDKLENDQLLLPSSSLDSSYSYRYINQDVYEFSRRMTALLKEPIVSEFEIFDIIVHTYIVRSLKANNNQPEIVELLNDFWGWVNSIRQEIADENYSFYMYCLDLAKSSVDYGHKITKASENIFELLRKRQKEISNKQLKLGRSLYSLGAQIVGR